MKVRAFAGELCLLSLDSVTRVARTRMNGIINVWAQRGDFS
jgi:hypothetical protein